MSFPSKVRSFSDGMSRRDIARDIENVTHRDDALGLGPEVHDRPTEWTTEHVAFRLIEAFETLMRVPGGYGPRMDANGWPSMLQEFSDLVDEEAMANARATFTKARSRPSAEKIARMDDALSWTLRFGGDEPLACDAVQLWAFCKAGRFSIASILRRRAAWAKLLAANKTVDENNRRRAALRQDTSDILAWAERMADERGLRGRTGRDYVEGRLRLVDAAAARHADAKVKHAPTVIAPHAAVPNKVLSRASLDRYVPRGLNLLRHCLAAEKAPIH